MVYYFLATILPIDQIIGRLYPFFGACLIIMAVSIAGATVLSAGVRPMPELWANFHSLYPGNDLPIWPLMCITVACGAISGFHSTQSPAMARCLKSERQGRMVFYGAMVSEGIIALIWAAAAIAFFYDKDGAGTGLQALLTMEGGNSTVVYLMSTSLLKGAGAVLAMLGVIACPITSGDTAFRSARLTLSDWFHIDQKPLKKRLMLALPLLGAGYFISFLNYTTIWRYFSWSNQVLATVGLWACAVYLSQEGAKKIYRWMAGIPAVFMSAVTFAYILQAEEGFRLPGGGSNIAGVVFAAVLLGLFIVKTSGDEKIYESA